MGHWALGFQVDVITSNPIQYSTFDWVPVPSYMKGKTGFFISFGSYDR